MRDRGWRVRACADDHAPAVLELVLLMWLLVHLTRALSAVRGGGGGGGGGSGGRPRVPDLHLLVQEPFYSTSISRLAALWMFVVRPLR